VYPFRQWLTRVWSFLIVQSVVPCLQQTPVNKDNLYVLLWPFILNRSHVTIIHTFIKDTPFVVYRCLTKQNV